MRAARYFAAVDSHTEGMPTRVVTGGVGPVPGATMLERKLHFEAHMDDLRLMLMREPRGHGAMSGAILQPPTRDDADWGVLFIEVSGLLPMCGHGTIGVATVLVETGMVEVTEPETVIRLDVPAGLVEARVQVEHGRAKAVTIRNVPSFLHTRDQVVSVPGYGDITYDMAFGGNFYAITPAADAGLVVDPSRNTELIEAGLAVMAAINAADRPVHPGDARINGCHHVVFHEPGRDGADAVAATSIHPGWLDRSPCGTGTSARMAQLWARGELGLDVPFVNQSVIGTRFTGRLVGTADVGGVAAVIPEITGRAWITGMGQYLLDASDPFPAGFALS
jgi:proline racemase